MNGFGCLFSEARQNLIEPFCWMRSLFPFLSRYSSFSFREKQNKIGVAGLRPAEPAAPHADADPARAPLRVAPARVPPPAAVDQVSFHFEKKHKT